MKSSSETQASHPLEVVGSDEAAAGRCSDCLSVSFPASWVLWLGVHAILWLGVRAFQWPVPFFVVVATLFGALCIVASKRFRLAMQTGVRGCVQGRR